MWWVLGIESDDSTVPAGPVVVVNNDYRLTNGRIVDRISTERWMRIRPVIVPSDLTPPSWGIMYRGELRQHVEGALSFFIDQFDDKLFVTYAMDTRSSVLAFKDWCSFMLTAFATVASMTRSAYQAIKDEGDPDAAERHMQGAVALDPTHPYLQAWKVVNGKEDRLTGQMIAETCGHCPEIRQHALCDARLPKCPIVNSSVRKRVFAQGLRIFEILSM